MEMKGICIDLLDAQVDSVTRQMELEQRALSMEMWMAQPHECAVSGPFALPLTFAIWCMTSASSSEHCRWFDFGQEVRASAQTSLVFLVE